MQGLHMRNSRVEREGIQLKNVAGKVRHETTRSPDHRIHCGSKAGHKALISWGYQYPRSVQSGVAMSTGKMIHCFKAHRKYKNCAMGSVALTPSGSQGTSPAKERTTRKESSYPTGSLPKNASEHRALHMSVQFPTVPALPHTHTLAAQLTPRD